MFMPLNNFPVLVQTFIFNKEHPVYDFIENIDVSKLKFDLVVSKLTIKSMICTKDYGYI